MPTEIPHKIMVLGPVPSHTIMSGAKADLGRLFNMMRNGSKVLPMEGRNQNRVAIIRDRNIIKKKLMVDSNKVTPICNGSVISYILWKNKRMI